MAKTYTFTKRDKNRYRKTYNFLRRKLVNKYSKNNFRSVYSMNERIKELKLKGKKNFQFINLDLLDSKKTYNLLIKI